ncbi:MAG: gliding motility-associated C-terminal domain-containing protein [Chitinophagaceae bacterium]
MVFTAYYDPSYKYKWYPEVYFTRDTVATVSDRIEHATYVRVNVEDDFGCKSSDSVYVNTEVCCELSLPNAFTPNGDGKNDRFRPLRDGKQTIITFRVVNRWGQEVSKQPILIWKAGTEPSAERFRIWEFTSTLSAIVVQTVTPTRKTVT